MECAVLTSSSLPCSRNRPRYLSVHCAHSSSPSLPPPADTTWSKVRDDETSAVSNVPTPEHKTVTYVMHRLRKSTTRLCDTTQRTEGVGVVCLCGLHESKQFLGLEVGVRYAPRPSQGRENGQQTRAWGCIDAYHLLDSVVPDI